MKESNKTNDFLECLVPFYPVVIYNNEYWNFNENGRWHVMEDGMKNGELFRKIGTHTFDKKREGVSFEKHNIKLTGLIGKLLRQPLTYPSDISIYKI